MKVWECGSVEMLLEFQLPTANCQLSTVNQKHDTTNRYSPGNLNSRTFRKGPGCFYGRKWGHQRDRFLAAPGDCPFAWTGGFEYPAAGSRRRGCRTGFIYRITRGYGRSQGILLCPENSPDHPEYPGSNGRILC